jgi:hypothetical protein
MKMTENIHVFESDREFRCFGSLPQELYGQTTKACTNCTEEMSARCVLLDIAEAQMIMAKAKHIQNPEVKKVDVQWDVNTPFEERCRENAPPTGIKTRIPDPRRRA